MPCFEVKQNFDIKVPNEEIMRFGFGNFESETGFGLADVRKSLMRKYYHVPELNRSEPSRLFSYQYF